MNLEVKQSRRVNRVVVFYNFLLYHGFFPHICTSTLLLLDVQVYVIEHFLSVDAHSLHEVTLQNKLACLSDQELPYDH